MNAAETIAVNKIVGEDEKRAASKQLAAGQYKGAFLARVSYDFKKGEDYEQNVVAKAEPWKLLAVALSKLNGVTVQALVTEATSGELDTEAIKKQADAAMKEIKGTTKTACAGKITGDFNLEIIPTSDVKVM